MKILKKSFLFILTVTLLAVCTNVKAYSGVVDSSDELQLPESLNNGQGLVTISRNFHDYKMYYQLVEIDNATYKQIEQLKDELLVAQYYNIYETEQTQLNYDNYESAYISYKDKYGKTVDDYTSLHIDEVLSTIIGLWADYGENWTEANGNNINIDLSQIEGTHDYVVWVKVVSDTMTVYDANTYELEGTKTSDNPSDDDKNNNTSGNTTDDNTNNTTGNTTNNDNTTSDDNNSTGNNTTDADKDNTTNNNNTTGDNDNNNTNNGNSTNNINNSSSNGTNNTNSKPKKDTSGDTTLTPVDNLPYTGVIRNIALFSGIITASIGAIVSYRRMKKM